MGSVRRTLGRVFVVAALAAGGVFAGLGAGAGQAIPPAGGLLSASPRSGAPGVRVLIRGSSFSCGQVELSWRYSNGELEIQRHVGVAAPKDGAFSYAARVPADAAQGWSTIVATGPLHSGCDGTAAFFICSTCLGDALPEKDAAGRSD